ncbi:hypothetical protein ABPG74_012606 [Tetrahymena malaccensis]
MTSQQDKSFTQQPQIVIKEIQNDIKDNKQQMEDKVQNHSKDSKSSKKQKKIKFNSEQTKEKLNQNSNQNNNSIGSKSQIQKSNLTIQISDTQLGSNPSLTLDNCQEGQKQDQQSQAELANQKNKKTIQKYNLPIIAAPQQFEKIDLKNEQHQRIIINILQKNRPKNNIETDIMFDLIENLPFFKNNKEVLSQSATTKELLQSLKLEYFQKNEILFSKGDIGNTFYIILSGSAYCLLELQKLEQNPKIKEEGSKKKILYNFDLATNPTFDQEQAALKQILPNMNMVKIFLPGESFGEIALITSQPSKLLSLLHFMKIQVFNKKHVLYKEGDKPDHIYFIKQGEVEISKQYDLDKEIEEKDTSLELQQWRTQRKAQIYKLNKVQQIKDKFEALFQIQVVILGSNNFFGEEDIFLNNTKRQSSATIISSQAEIFSIEKQKLFNELNIFQTLDMFEKEFKVKYQQQQINFQKNINSAIVQRKSQILKNMMKNGALCQSPSNQLQDMQACNSPKQIQGFHLPKLSQTKNSNFIQQSFGSETSKYQKYAVEDFSQQLQLNLLQSSENSINYINGGSNFGSPKHKLNTLQSDTFSHSNIINDRKNILLKISKSSSKMNSEPSNFQEYESQNCLKTNSQIMNNFDQNNIYINRTSLDVSKNSNLKLQLMNSQEFSTKNKKSSLLESSQEGYPSFYSKEQPAQNAKYINSPSQLDNLNLIDSSPYQLTDQLKYFRSPKMSKTLISINDTIRKNEEQKKYSQIDTVNRINKELEEKQLQLVDLNTRSLDLKEISGELLKIYIQKHSQYQMNESLQNIAQQRLLSMSSTLRDTSNNRLYMKYSGNFKPKKYPDNNTASTQRIPTLTSTKSQIQNSEKIEDEALNNDKMPFQPIQQENQTVSSQKKKLNIQVQIPNDSFSDWQDTTQQVSYTKSSFNKQGSFRYQSQQNTPKSNLNEFSKTHKRNEFHHETPMTTTEQFKYFKQQVDFLENSDKYIEKIKKSNNNQIKLSDILQTKESSQSPYQRQMNDKLTKMAFNDSMNLLSQEMFKGQPIKNVQLQRHHSVLLTGQISLDNLSPNPLKITKSSSIQQDGVFSNFLKNISNFSRLNSQMSEDDDSLSRKSDRIQERSHSLISMTSPIRISERRSISKFSDSSDQKIDQQQIQQTQKISNNNQLPPNPTKLQTKEKIEEVKKVLKNTSSSFKIESTLQNTDTLKKNQNSFKYSKNQEVIDNEQLIKNFKNASNPQLNKLYSQIQRINRLKENEKQKDYCNIVQSLQNRKSQTQIQQEANDIKQLILSQEKHKDHFSKFKGDQNHYKKIKDINHQQSAIFKPAKLSNRGFQQQQIDQVSLQTPLILQAQQKKINCQKIQNS